jgi:putative oxidoreductase
MSAFDFAMLLLRVSLGLTMAAHGYHKIFLGGRLSGTATWFDSLGMRPGYLHARVAAGTEIAAGIALTVGFFTPLAASAFVALMLVAAWTVHRTKGFYVMASGWEYTFVIAVAAVSVATLGGWFGLVVAGGVGILAGVAQLLLFYRPATASR